MIANPEERSYTALLEMLLDLRLSDDQRSLLRPFMEAYRTGAEHERTAFQEKLETYDRLLIMSPADRAAAIQLQRANLLTACEEQAKTGNPEALLMLEFYYASHPPIAEGSPHLTVELVNALLEFDYFFNVEIIGRKAEPTNAVVRDEIYRQCARNWETLSPAGRQVVFDAASKVAQQRLRWQNATPQERLQVKARIIGEQKLAPEEQAELEEIRKDLAHLDQTIYQQQISVMADDLSHLRRQQLLIFQ